RGATARDRTRRTSRRRARSGPRPAGSRGPVSLLAVTTATMTPQSSQLRRGQIYVALAAVAWSTAGVLQRQLSLDAATQVFGRAVFAATALLVYVSIAERGHVLRAFRVGGLAGMAVAVFVAIAAGSFISAL